MSFQSADNDLQNAASEVILLREEESKLRQENLQLKVSFFLIFLHDVFIYLFCLLWRAFRIL